MAPSHGCKAGFLLSLAVLSGCDTETAIRSEQPDPVLVEYPLVYLQRALIDDPDNSLIRAPSFDLRDPAKFNPGANLYIKNNALADTVAINLTAELFADAGPIDIRDLSVSDDGDSLLFSLRAPELEGVDEALQPSWNLWRYQHSSQQLQRLISNDNLAEQGDDLMPSLLPDGRIIFASTRQRLSRAILLDEGKPQYTFIDERRNNDVFNIHVMEADGSAIKQLSFNLSHDFYPLVQQNGKILYSRWDAMGGEHGINLYQMDPDGSENQIMFGWHSHQQQFEQQLESIEFVKPQQLANGHILLLLNGRDESQLQKRPVTINLDQFSDNQQPIDGSTSTDTAMADFVLANLPFSFSEQLNQNGRLNALYPLPDHSERYLLSWDLCRVLVDDVLRGCGQLSAEQLAADNVQPAPALYELWLLNNAEGTQQRIATSSEGMGITEAVVMQPSLQPKAYIADKVAGNELDPQLVEQLSGALHIRSVYDFDGNDLSVSANNPNGIAALSDPAQTRANERPARYLRVLRGVPMPPDEVRDIANTDFGRSRNQLMREILGYAPIQPDGSVKVQVPANVPLAISVLDGDGQRISDRHQQWISLRPGETLSCNGCHSRTSSQPHGRLDAQLASINNGAAGGFPFPNASEQIIPVQGQTMAEADAMVNGLTQLSANLSYRDIWTNRASGQANADEQLSYQALSTAAPAGSACFDNWTPYCRLQINYAEHIQPLWDTPRQTVDPDSQMLLADNTCTRCHNLVDSDNLAQVPAGQLALLAAPSPDQPAHLSSYRELLFNDLEQETMDGILVDRLIEVLDDEGNVVFQTDNDGELILDDEGNPIPLLTTVTVRPILSPNGARSSARFFEVLNNPTHQNMMSADELRLLSEWLDIGAQYYNTPFYPLP
ncbi:hypothetical protein [uncultured Ferrimonas sp.]|uniref:HzsA-related protein n=1 Tax=uncultured Ferrimonas sp. TaxID=432640 RepID=UPI0026171085|nr:hypothetical protein [uncultured Ferrimonas sp.]